MSTGHAYGTTGATNGEPANRVNGDTDFEAQLPDLGSQKTTDTITIPRSVFEGMYLNPPTSVRNPLRKQVGNPTPYGLMGFLVASSCLAASLMGWRGAGGNAAAVVGVFYFFGGMLQVIGSVLEWSLGNTFISVVFATYGAFWLMMGATLTPYFAAKEHYVKGLSGDALTAAEHEYEATFAFALLFVAVINFYFIICSVRTNAVLFIVVFFIELALLLVAGAYWIKAQGKTAEAENLQVAGGACAFVFCVFGWYLELHLMLQAVDFPIDLPVFDLSKYVKGSSELKKKGNKHA